MATAPVFDASESDPSERDAAALRFGRLERVRALQRARRRRRAVLALIAVTTLAGATMLVLAAVRQPSAGRPADTGLRPPAPSPARASAPVHPVQAPAPASAVHATPATIEPGRVAPTAGSPATPPANIPAPHRQPAKAPAAAPHVPEASASPRADPADPEAADPSAVIDWLLHTSRPTAR